jgi:hypothetical protein
MAGVFQLTFHLSALTVVEAPYNGCISLRGMGSFTGCGGVPVVQCFGEVHGHDHPEYWRKPVG